MAMPPLLIGVILIATLIAKFSLHFEWVTAIAVGLIAGGVAGFILPKGKSKYGVWMLLGGVILYFLAPQLASVSVPSSAQQLQLATFSVMASPVTSGVVKSGNTIIVPLTYDATNNKVDKDPVVIGFVVTRTDTGTNDASFEVSVTPSPKIQDKATGLQYESIEKDANDQYKIYIGSGTEFQGTKRVYPMKFGTTQEALNVTIDLNGGAFKYLNSYESVSAQVNVAGTVYTIVLQRIG